eukprot:gene12203-5790_t
MSSTYNPYSSLEEERIESSKDEFGQEQNEYNDEDQGSNDEKQEREVKSLDMKNITDDEKKLIEGILSKEDGIEEKAKTMFGFANWFKDKTFTFEDLKYKINKVKIINLEAKPSGEKHYCLPGGKSKKNEKEEDVLKRECFEEIGLPKDFKLKGTKG